MHFGRRGLLSVSVFVLALAWPGSSVTAQTTSEVRGSPPPASDADVLLDADVQVRSIRYQTVPKNAHVTVSGVNQRGGYRIVRSGIPAHPKAGAVYRNVRIRLQAASRFVEPARPPSAAAPSPAPPR